MVYRNSTTIHQILIFSFQEPAVQFLHRQAKRLNLPIKVHYPSTPTQPIVIITWPGANLNLKTIILNSHMDVVPVDAQFWTYPPFDAVIDRDNRIIARGTQDMKSMGIQYLAAIYDLKNAGHINARTIHIVFVPGV